MNEPTNHLAPSDSSLTLFAWQRESATAALAARTRWPHALLVEGRRGIGKRALIRASAPVRDSARGWRAVRSLRELRLRARRRAPGSARHRAVEATRRATRRPSTRSRSTASAQLTEFTQLHDASTARQGRGHRAGRRMNTAAANASAQDARRAAADDPSHPRQSSAGRLPATIVSRCQRLAARARRGRCGEVAGRAGRTEPDAPARAGRRRAAARADVGRGRRAARARAAARRPGGSAETVADRSRRAHRRIPESGEDGTVTVYTGKVEVGQNITDIIISNCSGRTEGASSHQLK